MAENLATPEENEPETSASGAPIYRHTDEEPEPFELASGDEQTIAAISDHIEQHIGPIAGVYHELLSDKIHLDVYVVAPSADFPFYTLVTSGMSERPMHLPPGAVEDGLPQYAELSILLPSTWNLPQEPEAMQAAFEDENTYWPIRWLKMMARLPHDYRTWLGFGHTVPNGEEAAPFADNTRLGCMLVLSAISLPEEFQTLTLASGKTIQFFTLFPLYPEEMELKMTQGVDAIFEGFEEYDISDVLDLDRPNVALVA